MKLTFRDSFIKHLQANLLAISGMFPSSISFERNSAEVIVDGMERSTNKRVTAKSPNWQFDRLVARLDRDLTVSSGRLDKEFLAIVQRSRMAAYNEIRGIDTPPDSEGPAQAVILGRDFTRLMDALKNFVNKQNEPAQPSAKLFQLEFERDESGRGIVKAYACNGFMLVENEAPCALAGEPFKAYISIPRLKPQKTDRVEIFLDGGCARISFGDVEFKTRQPNNPMNLRETKKNVSFSGESKTIFLNPQYLKTVAAAMSCAADREERLEITLHGMTEMVSFKCEGTEALLCPMRPPKEYLDVQVKKVETKAG